MPELRSTEDGQLVDRAVGILTANWRGNSTVPSRSLYPHQWSWDSAFIALGLRHVSPRRAARELTTLLGAQWADGRIPHIVFNPAVAEEAYFPGPAFWQSTAVPGTPAVDTSGIIQPPVHAIAALAVARTLPSTERDLFVRRVLEPLRRQSAYLSERRSANGLAVILHPWESGLDNSPAWDRPLAAVPAEPALLQTWQRRDLDHASPQDRPTNDDYSRYVRLALAYRDHDYNDDWSLSSAEFCVTDPLLNSIWAWSETALAKLSELAGSDGSTHRRCAQHITDSMTETLWDPAGGLFRALDVRTGKWTPAATVAGLTPLVLPGLPADLVTRLVATLQGTGFMINSNAVRGIPSNALDADTFEPRRYWRGPTWVNTSWLLVQGLRTHGHSDLADRLAADVTNLCDESGFWEYFDVRTGAGHGTKDFSWSAALSIDLVISQPPDPHKED